RNSSPAPAWRGRPSSWRRTIAVARRPLARLVARRLHSGAAPLVGGARQKQRGARLLAFSSKARYRNVQAGWLVGSRASFELPRQRGQRMRVQIGGSALQAVRRSGERILIVAARRSGDIQQRLSRYRAERLDQLAEERLIAARDLGETLPYDRLAGRVGGRAAPHDRAGALLHRLRFQETIEGVLQARDVERLGQVVVHSRLETALERAHHGVGGERYDG